MNEIERYQSILARLQATFEAKNHDYGNAFHEIYLELGVSYSYGKLREKLNRIKTLMKEESQVKGESMYDSLLDLASYAILTIMELEENQAYKFKGDMDMNVK